MVAYRVGLVFSRLRVVRAAMVDVMTKPLPWHDTPACVGCGEARRGTEEEVSAARRANVAWRAYERGEVHPDRGCDGCNCALPLDRYRLCSPCVEAENATRQGSLFPDLTVGGS